MEKMFGKFVKEVKKTTQKVYKEAKKSYNQRFQGSTKEIIGEQYFKIIETTEEGMYKTEVTARLIVLTKMSYAISKLEDKEQNDFKAVVKQNQHFYPFIENCEIYKIGDDGMCCIIDKVKKHIYFVFRGTKKGNKQDLINNFYIFFKNNPDPKKWKAYTFVVEILEQLVEQLPDHQEFILILAGHSLGGAIAESLTIELNDIVQHCESFNSGTTPMRKGRSKITAHYLGKRILSNKIVSHHMAYDPVSWGPVKGAIRDSIKNDKLFPHSIDNFLEIIFNFHQQNNPDGCQICWKPTTEEEKQMALMNKLPLYCNLHSPAKCSVCQINIDNSAYQSLYYFNQRYKKNCEIRIHKECWMCQFCGVKLEDQYICVDGFVVHIQCEKQMKQQLDQDEKEIMQDDLI